MRSAVFLLLLANLLSFAWTQGYLGASANPDARRLEQQLLADRLRVVSRGEPPPEAGKQAEVEKKVEVEKVVDKPAVESCQLWSELASTDADQVERLLAERYPAFKATRSTYGEITAYWVFIPPLASKEDANRKVAELQELGVKEYFIVPSSGSTPLAISLGLYRTEDAANARFDALRAKGVRSAKVFARRSGSALNSLEIVGPAAQADDLRQAIGALLPKAGAALCQAPGEAKP